MTVLYIHQKLHSFSLVYQINNLIKELFSIYTKQHQQKNVKTNKIQKYFKICIPPPFFNLKNLTNITKHTQKNPLYAY